MRIAKQVEKKFKKNHVLNDHSCIDDSEEENLKIITNEPQSLRINSVRIYVHIYICMYILVMKRDKFTYFPEEMKGLSGGGA
jgi:hypothetical protein